MNKPHKWAKEIKAWADGAEIEFRFYSEQKWSEWEVVDPPLFNTEDEYHYRIKPQPKEPQYLLAWEDASGLHITSENNYPITSMTFLGKIKLETDDE